MIPADFPAGGTLQVECIGAGGNGGASYGGGAYSKTNAITGITAGQTVYIRAGSSGTDSWFNKTTNAAPSSTTNGCLAKAGAVTTGGQSSAGVGDLKYSGGNGGDSYDNSPDPGAGGYAGGGAAGPNGNGANAFSNGGTYNAGGGGANGGSASNSSGAGGNGRGGSGGGAYSASGTAGNGTNGGGGGGTTSGTSGNGGPDFIWTDFAGVQWGPCGGGGGNANGTGGGGGGAGKAAGGANGLVVLTYTTGTASSYIDAVPGNYSTNSAYQSLGYYYVPYGVTSLKVDAIGSVAAFSSSGGGGAYASRTITVTPGGALYLFVNTSPTTGADTWVSTTNSKPTVDSSSVVLAKGAPSTTGGQASASFGDVKYSGGNRGSYNAPGFGGAAGPNGNGANGGTSNSNLISSSAGGGGGGANGGSAGANYITIYDGGAGGNNRLGSGGGTGAVDATASPATNGTGGGGGGGGGYYNNPDPEGTSSPLNSGVGSQENIWTTTNSIVYGPWGGAGGRFYPTGNNNTAPTASYGAYQYTQNSGQGLVVFTFTASAPPSTGNFLQFF